MTRTFTLLAAFFLAACSPNDGDFADYGLNYNSNVQGRMTGEMPRVGSIDNPDSYAGYTDSYDDFVYVELNAYGDFGWAMVYADFEVNSNGSVDIDPEQVIGCSGPNGEADFDEPATDAEINIEEVIVDGEEFLEIEIIAEFEENGTVVSVLTVPRFGE